VSGKTPLFAARWSKLVRTSRQMLHEIGREATPKELAEKLMMSVNNPNKPPRLAMSRRPSPYSMDRSPQLVQRL
jgi:DNA-directed RNA polymerase sigma subunit (sigma70/sigma32)